jgi:hypothetical protein
MKTPSLLSILILLAAASAPAHAQIYKWVDESGHTHYSDKAPASAKKVSTVTDRVSTYTPDPSLARAAAGGEDPVLSGRVDRLEQQLHAERLARQQAEVAAYAQASQAAYERCFADRRVDCDGYGGMQYIGPIAVVPIRHRRPIFVRTGNVVGPGIMPGTFNGPNAITAGNVTFRNNARAF